MRSVGKTLFAGASAIPGNGWAACTVVSAITTAASTILSNSSDKCSGRLHVNFRWNGQSKDSYCVG